MNIRIGTRTVLALTCLGCGNLAQGPELDRYRRRPEENPYVDKRCRPCRWKNLEQNREGRNGGR